MKKSTRVSLSRYDRRAPGQGAEPAGLTGTRFRVWAPRAKRVEVALLRNKKSVFPLTADGSGFWTATVEGVGHGDRYQYILDGSKRRPDPASRYQPLGVHGPSEVVDLVRGLRGTKRSPAAGWKGPEIEDLIFYELHVGTFTPGGTFRDAIGKIGYLKKLGVTCVEIMPVAAFPGKRNWGYDGVGLYAVQAAYGGPQGLASFVDACHAVGMAVCLDVVYNHFGPEGNYLNDFGPYFTPKYHTPWGSALNYDDVDSDPVRRFMIDNALQWAVDYRIDVLRLDAVHAIFDNGAKHILEEMNDEVQAAARALGRRVHLIAESDLNDSRVVRPKRQGGFGLAGQWSDDFHHAAHVLLTGEHQGYYLDYGTVGQLAKAVRDGFVYDGIYSPSRKRHHGNSSAGLPKHRLVTAVQNHDQVGNRAFGDRLGTLADFEAQKAAAALLLISPNAPLLFMGEEYGETRPFLYFVDHGDAGLIQAVREGRKREFAAFGWTDVPDPAAIKSFNASKLDWKKLSRPPHRKIWTLYRDLIKLRKAKQWTRVIGKKSQPRVEFNETARWLKVELPADKGRGITAVFSFSKEPLTVPAGRGLSRILINTASARYGGKGDSRPPLTASEVSVAPMSAVILSR